MRLVKSQKFGQAQTANLRHASNGVAIKTSLKLYHPHSLKLFNVRIASTIIYPFARYGADMERCRQEKRVFATWQKGKTMNDLISRRQAIDAFRKELCAEETESGREYAIGFFGIERVLNDLPSAQPEHNYCRECKWSRCHINADKYGNTETYWRCLYWCGETDEEGFCYNWERKNDG